LKAFFDWFKRHFNDPQVVILFVLLIFGTAVILTLGKILTPLLASVVIAYLLDGIVERLRRWRIHRFIAVLIVFLSFMAALLFLLFGLMPKISYQIGQVVADLPAMVARGQAQLMHLPERYPDFITQEQIARIMRYFQTEVARWGQHALSFSLASVRGLVTFLVYLLLVPLMVFFFLKDKYKIFTWAQRFMPPNNELANLVWHQVDRQTGNYIRGKFWETLIIWATAYVVFLLIDLQYAMLLGFIVGISVLVPYVGVVVVTFPVALAGYFQWGVGSELLTLLIAYGVIQLIDGNILAPLLFSEVVDLHPVAIIAAVLVFGGVWGFWGVFFAIPLATLIEAVLSVLPSLQPNKPDHDEIPANN
jgi:putative permease